MLENLIPAIEARRARRAISHRPIARETLDVLCRAAHLAPSCANSQPWRFVVIDEEPLLSLVKASLNKGNYWAEPAPAVIAVASRPDLDCRIPDGREYYLFGCGMAAMNLMLQATQIGLVAHPIAGFRQAPIKEILGLPRSYTLIVLIILGYPSSDTNSLSEKHRMEEVGSRTRRPIDEVVSWGIFRADDAPS